MSKQRQYHDNHNKTKTNITIRNTTQKTKALATNPLCVTHWPKPVSSHNRWASYNLSLMKIITEKKKQQYQDNLCIN